MLECCWNKVIIVILLLLLLLLLLFFVLLLLLAYYHYQYFGSSVHVQAVPCWWAQTMAKQLSMVAFWTVVSQVSWLCACVHGFGQTLELNQYDSAFSFTSIFLLLLLLLLLLYYIILYYIILYYYYIIIILYYIILYYIILYYYYYYCCCLVGMEWHLNTWTTNPDN